MTAVRTEATFVEVVVESYQSVRVEAVLVEVIVAAPTFGWAVGHIRFD